MYGTHALVELEIESARQVAHGHGLPFDHLVAGYAAVELHRLEALIARLREVGEPARETVENLLRWQDQLSHTVTSVFHYRHEQVERMLRLQVADLQSALASSIEALVLVEPAILEQCTSTAPADPQELARCVCSHLTRFEMLALFGGGYNAVVESTTDHQLIVLRSGIHDLLYSAMHLVVAFGTRVIDTDGRQAFQVRSLRSEPLVFEAALRKARELVELARGRRYWVDLEIDYLAPAQEQLVHRLLKGALNFVCFHEFGHIILTTMSEPGHQELLCDEFAANLVLASGDPLQTCGIYIALDFLQIVSMLEGNAGRSTTHPPVANRAKHFQLLIEKKHAELDSAHDALLDISTRLKEEQIFIMESMEVLRQRLTSTLESTDDLPLSVDHRRRIAEAISAAALSLPRIEEDAIVTLQFEHGQRYRVVRFDCLAAIAAAASAIAGLVGATNPVVVGASVVACLASLRSIYRPLATEEGAIIYILYQQHPAAVERANIEAELADVFPFNSRITTDAASALQALVSLGCVRQDGSAYQLAERVLVRMPWPPSVLPSSSPPRPAS